MRARVLVLAVGVGLQGGCSAKGGDGCTIFRAKLHVTGGDAVDHSSGGKETGSGAFNEREAGGKLGEVERGPAIHSPLCREIDERIRRTLHVDWKGSRVTGRGPRDRAARPRGSSGRWMGLWLAQGPG